MSFVAISNMEVLLSFSPADTDHSLLVQTDSFAFVDQLTSTQWMG